MDNNGWNEWKKFVLEELKRLNANYTNLNDSVQEMNRAINTEMTNTKVEIGKLKVKSGIWGLLGGFLPAFITLLYFLLKGSL